MAGILDHLTVASIPPGYQPGGFDCEQVEMNDYLCDGTALRDEGNSVTRTYLVRVGEDLVGYFSVLADAIQLSTKERPAGTNYSSAPALKLGRMGVDKPYKGQGVGVWILDYVVGLARSLAKEVGVRYVTLDALPEARLVNWYAKYGFVQNHGEERRRKIIREFLHKVGFDVDLPHVSMRFDILLRAELPAAG